MLRAVPKVRLQTGMIYREPSEYFAQGESKIKAPVASQATVADTGKTLHVRYSSTPDHRPRSPAPDGVGPFHHKRSRLAVGGSREAGQVAATFREVRLPRPVQAQYPHNHFSLADDWSKRSMMFTATLGADAVGYVSLLERGTSSTVWVFDLVTDAAHRRRGVASALLAAAQAWAESRSHRRLILETQSKNIPAIRLAQKIGFEFCGYNDRYYLNKDVALFFAKILK